MSIPWKEIWTSGPVWGLIIVQIGHDWGLFTIITDLPKYMKSVLHFSVVEVGILRSIHVYTRFSRDCNILDILRAIAVFTLIKKFVFPVHDFRTRKSAPPIITHVLTLYFSVDKLSFWYLRDVVFRLFST